ncbi:LysR family transcriptional regulator [Sorangium sp. So ce429]
MNQIYEKDLDVNLLRVFLVVSEAGSVAAAASRLYLAPPR